MTKEADQIFEINTHFLYELRWMICAAAQFQGEHASNVHVALLDSATVHGRNLFEFAAKKDLDKFTLASLGGTRQKPGKWASWANNRVTHMLERENARARAGSTWPDGLDNDRTDRFMVMCDAVLARLEAGGQTITPGVVKDAYDTMVAAARAYWNEPTEERHQEMAALFDDSKENLRPY